MKGNPARSFLRLRPYTEEEATVCPEGCPVPREIIQWDGKDTVTLLDPVNDFLPRANGVFTVPSDSVLWEFKDDTGKSEHPLTNQKTVYDRVVAPLVAQVVQGYDTAVCVAGSSSSGRVYTFYGPNIDGPDRGLLPRFVDDVFAAFEKQAQENSTLSVQLEVIDVSGETYVDLLAVRKSKAGASVNEELKVSQTPDGPVLSGSTSAELKGPSDFRSVIKPVHRSVLKRDSTHSVSFRFTESFQFEDPENPGQSITKSRKVHVLFALLRSMPAAFQRCIDVAVERDTRQNPLAKVLTRDTAFTKLYPNVLQQGYNLTFVSCVSPYYEHAREDYNTLQFAQKAAKLVGKPKLHQDEKLQEMRRLADEVKDLKTVVRRQSETMTVVQQELNAREVELMKQEAEHNRVTREMADLEEEIKTIQAARAAEVKLMHKEKKEMDEELKTKKDEVKNTKMAQSDKEATRKRLEASVEEAKKTKATVEEDIKKQQRELAAVRQQERAFAEEEKAVSEVEAFNSATPEERTAAIIRESDVHKKEQEELDRARAELEEVKKNDTTTAKIAELEPAYTAATKAEEPVREKEKITKEIAQLKKEIEDATRETERLQGEIDQKNAQCCVMA